MRSKKNQFSRASIQVIFFHYYRIITSLNEHNTGINCIHISLNAIGCIFIFFQE